MSVGRGVLPVSANGTTAIGVVALVPPTISTFTDWASAWLAESVAKVSRAMAKSDLMLFNGLILRDGTHFLIAPGLGRTTPVRSADGKPAVP